MGHRQSRSQEEEVRPHRNGGLSSPVKPPRPLRDPRVFGEASESGGDRDVRGLRRNSESSVSGTRSGNGLDSEGRKLRDERHRERRHRDGRPREGTSQGKKANHRLDIIDKLDVTSIYGTGRERSLDNGAYRSTC